ncbi:MAG: hypothetical protein ABSB49_18035 [Polyangia bacterium]
MDKHEKERKAEIDPAVYPTAVELMEAMAAELRAEMAAELEGVADAA